MKCPSCGATQPFDLTCVKCSASLSPEKRGAGASLLVYRLAILFFLGLFIALAILDREGGRPPSTRRTPSTPERQSEPLVMGEIGPKEIPGTETVSQGNATPLMPALLVVLERDNLTDYETYLALRNNVVQTVKTVSPQDLRRAEAEEGNFGAVIAIGMDSARVLNGLQLRRLTISLSSTGDIAEFLDPQDRAYGILTDPGPEFELVVAKQLFPEAEKFVLPMRERGPLSNLTGDLKRNVEITGLDPNLMERELTDFSPDKALILLHHPGRSDLVRVLEAPGLANRRIVVGLGYEDLGEEVRPPLIHLSISPQGLGKQAALLAAQLTGTGGLRAVDQWPKAALQINLHTARAREIGGDDLVKTLSERAALLGFQFRLVQ